MLRLLRLLRWLNNRIFDILPLHLPVLFLFFYYPFLSFESLEAKLGKANPEEIVPIYERLLKESPETLTELHLVQEVDLSTGAFSGARSGARSGALSSPKQEGTPQKGTLQAENPQAHYTYDNQGRIVEVWRNSGPTDALICCLKCRYAQTKDGSVVHCENLDGAKWHYHFSGNQLTSIDTLLNNSLLRTERLTWQGNQLIEYAIHDSNNACLGSRRFSYSEDGREKDYVLASSTLTGNLTGLGNKNETLTTSYTYDAQGRLIKKDQGEITEILEYSGTSSLVTADYTLRHDTPIQRIFYTYDHEGNCLQFIQDNGSSMDRENLTGVTQRAIMNQTFHTGAQTKSLPQCIDVLHLDIESGQEVLDHTWICLYDAQGHLVQRQECNGKGELFSAIAYAYDAQGKLLVEEHLEGPTYTYIHSPRSLKILCCQKANSSTSTFTYDGAGRLLREEQESPEGSSYTQFRYNRLGSCIEQEDTLGNITTFHYDALGRKIQEERPAILGLDDEPFIPRLSWEYDSLDRPLKHVDADGYTTHISCTLYGQPAIKKYPDGTTEEMHYTLTGQLHSTRNRAGEQQEVPTNTSLSTPSALHSPSSLSKNVQRKKVRNTLGQWVFQEECIEKGLLKISTYDALSQLSSLEERDITTGQGGVRLHTIRYNGSGLPIMQQWSHDGDSTNLPPYTIQYTYGPMGRLEKVVEGVGSGRERQMLYAYDAHGRLSSLTKPDGCRIDYTYDQKGRIATLQTSDKTLSYLYHYDEANNPIAIDNLLDGTSVTRQYDASGRLLEEKLSSGHVFTYQYDAQGRLLNLTLPDQSRTCYTYAASGLQTITRQSPSHETRYTERLIRNEMGELQAIELPYQLGEIRYTHDAAGKRCALSSPFFQHSLSFSMDSPSKIASEERTDTIGTYSTAYTHDAWEQLIAENLDGQQAPPTQSYTYDALGNRIMLNGARTSVHANNDLDSTQDTHYTYDQSGNRVRSIGPLGTHLYQYDALNRLTSIEQPHQSRTTYTYDPFHRRSSRTTWSWNPQEQTWQMQEQETFLYQGDLEVGSIDSLGNATLRVLMPNTPSESGATVAIEHHSNLLHDSTVQVEHPNNLYIPLQDLHGSTAVLLDAHSRQPVEAYRRNAFGQEQLYGCDPSDYTILPARTLNPWRMEGKRHDPESGLIYYGQRFYDPAIGMWLTKDPLGLCDGPQDRLFVCNNPLHRMDLHGQFSLSKLWNTLSEYTLATAEAMHQAADGVIQFLLHDHDILNTLKRDLLFMRGVCCRLISHPFLKACNFYTQTPKSGVYGQGEISDSMRFSYVNGILNTEVGLLAFVKQLSELHGGANIHYTFRPSEGWTLDLLKAVLLLRGYTSPTAHSLVGMWRELIEEMGGLESNGVIIHYAHSLGSAETASAERFLTDAERRKLRIFTFGSPVLIQDTGFAGVTNYVSRLDIVSLFDPYRYFPALFGSKESNIVFLGNYWGLPLFDHVLDHPNYFGVLTGLGRFFTQGVNFTQGINQKAS